MNKHEGFTISEVYAGLFEIRDEDGEFVEDEFETERGARGYIDDMLNPEREPDEDDLLRSRGYTWED